VVENMSGVQRPLSDVRIVGDDGVDQTEAFIKVGLLLHVSTGLRLQQHH
jgi:hypothetical protein